MMDVWRALLLLHAQNEKAPFGYLTRKVLEGVSGALQVCPLTTMYVSSYYYICVLILLYMCPHITICVSSCYYMCPHTTMYVSSYYYVCVLILLTYANVC